MDKQIELLGVLGEKFGSKYVCSEKASIKDTMKLIECQNPEFKAFLIEALELGFDLAIVNGDHIITDYEEIFLNKKYDGTTYMALVPTGSGGFGKILAAIAIIAFAIYMPVIFAYEAAGIGAATISVVPGWAAAGGAFQMALFSLGANLLIGGITELLTKAPKKDREEEAGTIFNGPANSIKTGQPIPILYGKLLIGGTAISINYQSSHTALGNGGVNPGIGTTYDGSYNGMGAESWTQGIY
jgi:predicted phage tail protein